MRFYLPFAAAWTIIVAQEQSVVSIEDDPNPVGFGNTVILQNSLPSNAGKSVQDDMNEFNVVDEVEIPPPHSPDAESQSSKLREADDPGTGGDLSNWNVDFVSFASNSLADTGNLEAYCPTGHSAMPGKLRKRQQDQRCLNRMHVEPETADGDAEIRELVQEDAVWKKKYGMAALKETRSPCINQGFRRDAACCRGTPEYLGLGGDGIERYSYPHCVAFMLGRPWCSEGPFCCQNLIVRPDRIPGLFFGVDCRQMP